MKRDSLARTVVLLAAACAFAAVACEQKKAPTPATNQYQVGSVVVNLPPDVKVPLPQGRPDEASVNQTKCNYAVDKQIDFMTKAHPEYKAGLLAAKPSIMAECLSKWTQPEYDCIVASKSLQQLLDCKKFQKPLRKAPLVADTCAMPAALVLTYRSTFRACADGLAWSRRRSAPSVGSSGFQDRG